MSVSYQRRRTKVPTPFCGSPAPGERIVQLREMDAGTDGLTVLKRDRPNVRSGGLPPKSDPQSLPDLRQGQLAVDELAHSYSLRSLTTSYDDTISPSRSPSGVSWSSIRGTSSSLPSAPSPVSVGARPVGHTDPDTGPAAPH